MQKQQGLQKKKKSQPETIEVECRTCHVKLKKKKYDIERWQGQCKKCYLSPNTGRSYNKAPISN